MPIAGVMKALRVSPPTSLWLRSILRLVLAFLVVATSIALAEDDELLLENNRGDVAEASPDAGNGGGDVADDAELEAMLNSRESDPSDLPTKAESASRETASPGDDVIDFDEERPGEAEEVYALPEGGGRVPQFEDPQEDTDQIQLLRFHRKLISEREKYRDPGEDDQPLVFHIAGGPSLFTEADFGASLDFQFAFTRHFTLGLVGNYISITNQTTLFGQAVNGIVSAVGAGAALNFYSRQPYEGIWIQAGSGYDFLTDASKSLGGQIPIFFSFGWRFIEPKHNLTFAFGAGSHAYFFNSDPRVYLTLKLEIGFGWNVFPH